MEDDLTNSETIFSTKWPNLILFGNLNSSSLTRSNSDKLKVGKPVIEKSRQFAFNIDAILGLDSIFLIYINLNCLVIFILTKR